MTWKVLCCAKIDLFFAFISDAGNNISVTAAGWKCCNIFRFLSFVSCNDFLKNINFSFVYTKELRQP